MRIILPVFRAGETYAVAPDITEDAAADYWMGTDKCTFITEIEGDVVGTYYQRANHAGGGDHICNCGYIVRGDRAGRGIARAMAEHSLTAAKAAGFRGMQYNFVVSTNQSAIRIWRSLGFDTIGTIPRGFDHPKHGLVDTLIMYRDL